MLKFTILNNYIYRKLYDQIMYRNLYQDIRALRTGTFTGPLSNRSYKLHQYLPDHYSMSL